MSALHDGDLTTGWNPNGCSQNSNDWYVIYEATTAMQWSTVVVYSVFDNAHGVESFEFHSCSTADCTGTYFGRCTRT